MHQLLPFSLKWKFRYIYSEYINLIQEQLGEDLTYVEHLMGYFQQDNATAHIANES